jgi:hypothetical protein
MLYYDIKISQELFITNARVSQNGLWSEYISQSTATREHEKSTNRNQGMLYHLHASLKQTNEMPVIHYRHNSRQAKSTCCLYVHKS